LSANWKVSTVPTTRPNPGNNQDRTRPGTTGVNFVGTSTEWAALVPLPANGVFSALAGFDSTRPALAPSRKPPHNISAEIECVKCKHKGHYATACTFIIPTAAPQLFQSIRPSVQFNQTQLQSILVPGSIIVDSGSTINCFRERDLISNIHPCEPFNTFSNGGGMTYMHKRTLTVFVELDCYYNPECLVNIISLDLLQDKYHTTFDSEKRNVLTVEVADTLTITFEGLGSGLYFVNLNKSVTAYTLSLLNTVKENKQFYSHREIQGT